MALVLCGDNFQSLLCGVRAVSLYPGRHFRTDKLRHGVGHPAAQNDDLGAQKIHHIGEHDADNPHPASNEFLDFFVTATDRLREMPSS